MDRGERYEALQRALLSALSGHQADLWTSLPGYIVSYDAATETCEFQPTLQVQYTSPVDDSKSWITLPLLPDCPVLFPSGGGCTLSFPLKENDEGVVFIASRCIDAWWQQSGSQPPPSIRMHDLSDGFVFVGPRSQPRVHSPSLSTDEVQLRTDDGGAFIAINPSNHNVRVNTSGGATVTATGEIDLISSAKIKMTAPLVQIDASTSFTVNGNTIHNGNTALNGNVTQTAGSGSGAVTLIGPVEVTHEVTANGHTVGAHTHSDPQGGTVGPPTG